MDLTHRASPGARHTFALVCGVFLAVGAILAGIGPILPHLATNVGYDIAALGSLFTAISSGVMLAQFGIGPAIDRFGQRPVLTAGLLLMSVGTVGVTLGRSLAVLLVGALLVGLGFGSVLTSGNILIARLFPRHSATALNGVNVFFGVGSMLGPAAAGVVGMRMGTPQVALWVGAGLLFALAPVVLNFAVAPQLVHADLADPSRGPSRPAGLWLLGFLLLLYSGTEVGFSGWVTLYLVNAANFTPATAALGAAAFWLALTLGRALGTILGLRLTPLALLTFSVVGLLGGAVMLISTVGTPGGSIASVVLLGFSSGPIFPTVIAIVTTATQGSGTPASRVLALGTSGGLILPALLGLLLTRYGPPAMAGMILAVALALVALCVGVGFATAALPPASRREAQSYSRGQGSGSRDPEQRGV
jgi:MFS transporter, FHS family, L-fucose permease